MVMLMFLFVFPIRGGLAADPILLGAPLSTAYLYGWDAERGIKLAIEEINAKDVLSRFNPSGNNYRAVTVVKNSGIGQAESMILSGVKAIKERPVEVVHEPNSKDILTKKDKVEHNNQVFSDQGLVTPPPLSPTR